MEENGKLNVNLLRDKNGNLNRPAIDRLLRLIDLINRDNAGNSKIGYGVVPAIIDWTDSDDVVTSLTFIKHENMGAESDYYSSLKPPYLCANKPLYTAEELLLVKGITADVFDLLYDYITIKGNGKVNINCAPKLVIESLSSELDPVLAQMIVDRRKTKPFDSIFELRDVPGMTDRIYNAIRAIVTVGPEQRYYRIMSQANLDNISSTVAAILQRDIETENVEIILYKEL